MYIYINMLNLYKYIYIFRTHDPLRTDVHTIQLKINESLERISSDIQLLNKILKTPRLQIYTGNNGYTNIFHLICS